MSAMPNLESAQIGMEHNDRPATLPMLRPTIGPPLADIRGIYREAGCYAYDPALGETGICRSAITYVDGDNGVLLYRGYPIAISSSDAVISKSAGCCSTANYRPRPSSTNLPTTSRTTRW